MSKETSEKIVAKGENLALYCALFIIAVVAEFILLDRFLREVGWAIALILAIIEVGWLIRVILRMNF